jgi:hypothetical protein
MMQTFEDIWRTNAWRGRSTRSGPGSSPRATAHLAPFLRKVVADFAVDSLLDAPCGEGKWFPETGAEYFGVDTVPGAIAKARRAHSRRQYAVVDILNDLLPMCDAVFSRDFMQHLSLDAGVAALENFRHSGAYLLIASTFLSGTNDVGAPNNWDAYPVNLAVEPFNLGEPLELIADGKDERGRDIDPDKFMGVWEL